MAWGSMEILKTLDECARDFGFPVLADGYLCPAATRLALFRSSSDWAITIEVFGFSPRAGLPDTTIYTFGSQVARLAREADFVAGEEFEAYLHGHPYDESSFVYPVRPGAWQDSEDHELVAAGENPIVLRGETLLTPDPAEYVLCGICLESSQRVRVAELCRFLAAIRRDQVLATPEERRACVPEELQQILQLEEWRHPDIDRSEPPSSTEAFRQLAEVLVARDPSLYRPTLVPNTH
jgi:hypothetical protein